MRIQVFPSGPFATNAYVVECPETKEAFILDPAPKSAAGILAALNEHALIPKAILLTHSHWDHTADVAPLQRALNIPVLVHEADAENVRNPGSDGLPIIFAIEGVEPTSYLKEGDTFALGNLVFRVLHTPGHTPGGICLFEEREGVLFSGDTLFQGSIGNLSFPTANADEMWKSLKKLEKLPPSTQVFPGHGPGTTIERENWLPRAKELFGG